MDDLDLLKKDWQKSDNFKVITEQDIYGMLHKKSSSIVRIILIVSILEILFWFLLGFFVDSDDEIKTLNNEKLSMILDILGYLPYVLSIVFICLFYKNYTKISTISTTKELMKDILQTRKTVHYYIYCNLGMIVFSFIFGMAMIFVYNPEMKFIEDKIANDPSNLLIMILAMFAVLILLVGAFWLFYKLLYGFLLKKLKTNYDELLKIDL